MREGNVGAAGARDAARRARAHDGRAEPERLQELASIESHVSSPPTSAMRKLGDSDDVDEERAHVAAALHEALRERVDGRRLDVDRRAAERVADQLLRRAVVDDLALRERLRERDRAVEGAVHVGADDGAGRVDGERVVGRLVVPGGVVVLEAEAEAVQPGVARLADRRASSAARRACGWSAGPSPEGPSAARD